MTVRVKATPGALYPQERTPYSLHIRLSRQQDLNWTGEKIEYVLPPPVFELRNFQALASHSTGYTTPAPNASYLKTKYRYYCKGYVKFLHNKELLTF